MPEDDFMWLFKKKRNLRFPARPALGAAVHTAVLPVSMKRAPSKPPCSMATKRRRAWSIRL